MKKIHIALKMCVTLLIASISSTLFANETGLQLYSLRHQMEKDVPAAIAAIEEWGVHAVEGGGNLYGHSLSEFKSILDRHHIQVVSVDTSFEEVRDNPIAIAYKAKFFGARFATFYWIPHEGAFSLEDAKAAVDAMNKAGKILDANGVTLQYHPHGYEFSSHEDGTILDYMLKNVEHAKFQMDVFWVKQGGQDPADLLARYPGKFTTLHLKDRKHGTPNSSNGRADVEASVTLGTGDIKIDKVVEVAKQQGIRYFFIEDESSGVMSQVPQSIRYLMKLNGQTVNY